MMQPGEQTVYYVGNLSADAFHDPQVARLRDTAQRLSNMRAMAAHGEWFIGMGLVTLTQRVVDGQTNYIAVKLR